MEQELQVALSIRNVFQFLKLEHYIEVGDKFIFEMLGLGLDFKRQFNASMEDSFFFLLNVHLIPKNSRLNVMQWAKKRRILLP